MRAWRSVVLVLVMCLAITPVRAQTPSGLPARPATTLSEVAELRARLHVATVEIVQLRAALARMQAEADLLRLSAQQESLEAMMRQEQKPPAGAVFNWQTLTFDPPQAPK